MSVSTLMAQETLESASVVRRLLGRRDEITALAQRIDLESVPLAVICARGSSGHAGVFLRYLIESRLGLPVSATAPSITTALKSPLKLYGSLFIVISQSGEAPDLLAAMNAAAGAGAMTVGLINAAGSPIARASRALIALDAGPERSVAATKSVIAAMVAGTMLVAALAGDTALDHALDRLPERLEAAGTLDWSEAGTAFSGATCGYVTGRGFGYAPAREIALKCAETMRLPVLAYSAAELLHGPRAAITPATPVLALRVADETAASVDMLVSNLRASDVPVFVAGGSESNLPWIGDDHPVADAIAMLVPAYRVIEQATRRMGYDPDRPPHLNKVTRTL